MKEELALTRVEDDEEARRQAVVVIARAMEMSPVRLVRVLVFVLSFVLSMVANVCVCDKECEGKEGWEGGLTARREVSSISCELTAGAF